MVAEAVLLPSIPVGRDVVGDEVVIASNGGGYLGKRWKNLCGRSGGDGGGVGGLVRCKK
jgi:hypothetical protein